jgi:hypothetical protein
MCIAPASPVQYTLAGFFHTSAGDEPMDLDRVLAFCGEGGPDGAKKCEKFRFYCPLGLPRNRARAARAGKRCALFYF